MSTLGFEDDGKRVQRKEWLVSPRQSIPRKGLSRTAKSFMHWKVAGKSLLIHGASQMRNGIKLIKISATLQPGRFASRFRTATAVLGESLS